MPKLISFILIALSLFALLVNAVLIVMDHPIDPLNTFILAITGIIFGSMLYKKE